jgi:hypothetical protein
MANGHGAESLLAPGAHERMAAHLTSGHARIVDLAERFQTKTTAAYIAGTNPIHRLHGWSMRRIGDRNRVSIDLQGGQDLKTAADCGFEGFRATLSAIYHPAVAAGMGLEPKIIPALVVTGRNTDGQAEKLAEHLEGEMNWQDKVATIYCFDGGQVIKLTRVPAGFKDPDDPRQPVFKSDSDQLLLSPMTADDFAHMHYVVGTMCERMDADWDRYYGE